MDFENLLLEYKNLKLESNDIERRIRRIEKQSEFVGDVVQNGVKGRAVIYGVDVKRKNKLRNLKKKFEDFNLQIIEIENQVEDFIEKIPSSKTRNIFRLRYFDNKKWFEIAHIMGYNDEDAPRKNHDRFFKKIDKMSGHVRF